MINVVYESSNGHRYDLKADPIRIKNANFHNYSWTREVISQRYGEKVQRFAKEAQEYETVLYFTGIMAAIRQTMYDLHNDFERDIINQTPAKLWWHDSYIPCYVTASSTYPHDNGAYVCNEITIYCPSPFWIEEKTFSFYPVEEQAAYPYLDFNTDFAFDFSYKPRAVIPIETGHYAPSSFRMIMHGPCVNPSVTIGGNVYNVYVSVPAGGYLVIDSRPEAPLGWQVYMRDAAGVQSNIFDNRNPNYQILKRIPGGTVNMEYSRTYGIDLTLYLERSEPSWMN
ncbi:MAG: hypothetical protein IKR95_03880 [Oscillospiraceae bacterium]|nr:hypothetical protein [Oscillospiraceae bacterium]